jgi:dienelactone hydrolase/Fe-S cluster assembly iron-binding protein IscA
MATSWRRFWYLVVVVTLLASAAAHGEQPTQTLREARQGFHTTNVPNAYVPAGPAPEAPTGSGYVRVKYRSPVGDLVAYLTPDPGDGKKRPAIVWAQGGFGGIDEEFCIPQPASNDQTPKTYLDAGFVVMIPSWRGENDNPGKFELFLGEVDDATSAVEYVARLPYVDSNRVYMGGHSTGGTIALLTALYTDKLRAVISFGGAPDIGRVVQGKGYGNTPFDPKDKHETHVRSAIDFTETLRTPTWYFEGADSTYVSDAARMQRRATAAHVPFAARIVEGGTHFTILAPLNAMLAQKLLADTGAKCNITVTPDEVSAAFQKARAAGQDRRAKLPLVTLTPAAAAHIKSAIRKQGFDPAKTYLTVEPSKLDVTENLDVTAYEVVTCEDLRVAVKKAIAGDVRGTRIDYIEGKRSGFVFHRADE